MRAGVLIGVVAYITVTVVLPSVICWLKGKRFWAVLGILSLWHFIPMVRLAKPDSWWARRYYDDDKLLRSNARYGRVPAGYEYPDVASLDEFSPEDIAFQDKITRKAWKKAQRQRA